MRKRCTYLALLITMLALIPASISLGAFDAKKDPALVGYWSFDEGTGTTAADSSSYHRNGSLQGGATWGPGRFGSGVVLNGTSAYVAVSNFQLTTDKITMVAWVKGWKAADWAALVTGHPARLEMCFGDNTTLHYAWNNDSSATWSWAGGPVIPQDTWALVALTIDPTQAVAYVYSDQGGLTQGTNAIAHISQTFAQLGIGFSFSPRYVRGTIDEVAVYSRALTREEILALTKGPTNPALAGGPRPADKAADVPRDIVFAWTAGPYAGTHDVYVGTVFADVNTAGRTDKKGVLASQGQAEAAFDPPGVLAYGQTYYWRVDEVNKTPDNTITKGNVWSFTVEPYGYPVKPVKVTASSNQTGMGPEKTIDGSGMTGDLHGIEPTTMWLSAGAKPNWIQYEFDKAYRLGDLQVWNSNQLIESLLGFGAKNVTVETSTDGTTWAPVANVPEFGRAPGTAGYAANTTVNFGGVEAKFVKLTINANWGGMAPQTGLAEVRFSYIPVQAHTPQPATAGKGVAIDTALNWRPGREAASHKVYFGTDKDAVTNGTAPAKTVEAHGFTPDPLILGTTYYWRVDEVGAASYPGDVWSFTTQEYKVVDDFESYTDQAGGEVFTAWIDGYATNLNGSTVGNEMAANGTFGETAIVHGGKQSMPMDFDNSKSPFYSEAEQTFAPLQDWTGNGANSLNLWVRGYPALTSVAVTETAGKISLTGDGADIWGASDQFTYAYKTLTGDGSMIARVVSNGTGSNTWAKGGVMIRDSLDGRSASAQICLTGSAGNGACFQNRATTGLDMGANDATSNTTSTSVIAPPYWVRLERVADNITAYLSADGKSWRTLGTTQTIAMAAPVYIGLCVTSHAAGEQRTFQFDSIATTGGVSGAWQGAEITSPQSNSAQPMYVIVEDSAGKTATATNATAANAANWTPWNVPFGSLTGVNLAKVKKLTIGVGDKKNPAADGSGRVFIDDIGFGKPAQ